MSYSAQIAIGAAGAFFLTGLFLGAWKYIHIHTSSEARAPVYVDIAHRASLMYAFACLLNERFVELSDLSDPVETSAVLAQIAPRYIETQVYHAILEAQASEHSARMIAMQNATDNANELIDELTLDLNKARQESITGELLDIVGGVAGVQG